MITDKKAMAEWKRKHDLHVMLLMERFKFTKTQAVVQAYARGVEGLPDLMGTAAPLVPPAPPVDKK